MHFALLLPLDFQTREWQLLIMIIICAKESGQMSNTSPPNFKFN
jgi:hypothetical protein